MALCAHYFCDILSGTIKTGRVVKMRLPRSISRATAVNSPPGPSATHRRQEVQRVGRGERILDEPGGLPVGFKGDLYLFERDAPAHQPEVHPNRFRSQVVEGCRRADASRLAAGREEDIPDGWAGFHPGDPDLRDAIAYAAADGTARLVVCVKFCKLRYGIAIGVQAAALRSDSFFCSLRKDIFKYRVASIQCSWVSMASARINRRHLSLLGKIRTNSSAGLSYGLMDSRSDRRIQ